MKNIYLPDRKIYMGGIAGVIAWGLLMIADHFGFELAPGAKEMLPTLIGFIMSYVVPPSKHDIINRLNDDLVKMAAADPTVPVNPTTAPLPVAPPTEVLKPAAPKP